VLRVDTRQTVTICRVPNARHTAKLTAGEWPLLERIFAVCLKSGTRQRVTVCHVLLFAVCFSFRRTVSSSFAVRRSLCRVLHSGAHGKDAVCRVPVVCRVFLTWLTAKAFFAVCPIYCTRQTWRHKANARFTVVGAAKTYTTTKTICGTVWFSRQRGFPCTVAIHSVFRIYFYWRFMIGPALKKCF